MVSYRWRCTFNLKLCRKIEHYQGKYLHVDALGAGTGDRGDRTADQKRSFASSYRFPAHKQDKLMVAPCSTCASHVKLLSWSTRKLEMAWHARTMTMAQQRLKPAYCPTVHHPVVHSVIPSIDVNPAPAILFPPVEMSIPHISLQYILRALSHWTWIQFISPFPT